MPIELTGPIVQKPGGAWPTAYANLIQGGCWQVADSTARDAIPTWGQFLGLLVVLQSDGSIWQQTTYPLTGVDGDWTQVGGGGSGTVTSVATDGTLTGGPITTTGTLGIATDAALPGSPTTTTQSALDNSTKIATTAYVDAAVGTLAAAVIAEDYLTANQMITISGDASGSGTTAITATLTTVNTDVGSYGSSTAIPSFTVNAKGLVTAASTSVVIAPAGTLSGTTLNATVVTSSLTAVGTIGTGAWEGTIIAPAYGGTGIDNGSSTITIGGDVAFSGAHTFTGTLTGDTSVTFPTSGTLVTSTVTTLSDLVSIGTISTGTWEGTEIAVAYGGTGSDTLTAHAVLLGEGTSAVGFATIGTAGRALVDQGSGADPLFSSTGLVIAQHTGPITTDTESTGDATCNLATTDWHLIVLNADLTIALSNVSVGQQFTIVLQQEASGGPYSVASWFSGTIHWMGGTYSAPTMPATASAYLTATFKCISSGVYLAWWLGNSAA